MLRAENVDALHVGDIGLAKAFDEEILARARDEGVVVVTLDADFHALMALSGSNSPSVIRVRIEGLHAEELTEVLLRVLGACSEALESGALVSVEPQRVRVRRLPLLG